jgi:hypothetical protein
MNQGRTKVASVSKSQRRFFGMVDAYKSGDMPGASPAIRKAGASMSAEDVNDFASTKHKGLPEKVGGNALKAAIMGKNRVVDRVAKAKMRKK